MQYILGAGELRFLAPSGLRKEVFEGFGAQDRATSVAARREGGLSKAAPWGDGEDQADGLNS